MSERLVLHDRFSRIDEPWRPKAVAELNGQALKLITVEGVFPWRTPANEDDVFRVWRGRFRVEFKDRIVELGLGEAVVAPRGVEHRTAAVAQADVLCFEVMDVRNAGDVLDPIFTAPTGAKLKIA
jgi:mannose-6-phosphate isomerase-like protein (cupin superfamily)